MCKVVLLKSSSRLSLAAEMFGGTDFRPILYIQEPLTDFHGNEAKKKNYGRLKTTEFFKITNSQYFL